MGQFEQTSVTESGVSQFATRDFSNNVAYFIDKYGKRHQSTKHLSVDDRMADQNLTYYTDQVEMEDGRQYIVGYNTIEPARELERNPEDKRFPGSNILVVEGTAFTTKNGGFYKPRHDELALVHKRPSIIIGVQQRYDKYNNLNKTTDDMLAITAFYAASMGYDQKNITSMGTSRGGMLALLLQKRAKLRDMNVLHADSMVPCIPTPLDAVKMVSPRNMYAMLKNELDAVKKLEIEFEEALEMYDTLDVVTIRGIIQQLKEAAALALSNIAHEVQMSEHRDDVGDINVQKGDRMSFSHKWQPIYRDHPHMRVVEHEGGGHSTSVGKPFNRNLMRRQEAIATVLHADPANRHLGGAALRNAIDLATRHEHQLAV